MDYRDRWVTAPTGYPVLTLRRINNLVVRHMREGSFIAEAMVGFRPVTRLEEMTDDLRRTTIALKTKPGTPFPEPHPDRVRLTRGQTASRVGDLDERASIARDRREARARQLEEA